MCRGVGRECRKINRRRREGLSLFRRERVIGLSTIKWMRWDLRVLQGSRVRRNAVGSEVS